ncbi:MAG: Xaa-Pro peptidase family protein [Candidatus Omnitrophota bacterium]
MRNRQRRLRSGMAAEGLDGFLLQNLENIGYFTGLFLEDVFGIITSREILLFAQPLVYQEALFYLSGNETVSDKNVGEGLCPLPNKTLPLNKLAALWDKKSIISGLKKIGLEPELPAGHFVKLQESFPTAYFELSLLPLQMRSVKDETEITLIRQASRITKNAFRQAQKMLKPGTKEEELALLLQGCMEKSGAGTAFPVIAASGERTFFPHAIPTTSRISNQDWVMVDFGAKYSGYCSDITRVFFPGKKDKQAAEILRILSAAKKAAEEKAGPGVPAKDVDAAGRNVLKKKGLDQYFIHGIGHGVGLSVHEEPILSPRSRDILKPGMVITLEPAVYIPGWGGMRMEDTYLVTKTGLENLTK